MNDIKLTPAQKDYLGLLAEAGTEGRITQQAYRPAKKLVELKLAKWNHSLRPLNGHQKLEITPAGKEFLNAGKEA